MLKIITFTAILTITTCATIQAQDLHHIWPRNCPQDNWHFNYRGPLGGQFGFGNQGMYIGPGTVQFYWGDQYRGYPYQYNPYWHYRNLYNPNYRSPYNYPNYRNPH